MCKRSFTIAAVAVLLMGAILASADVIHVDDNAPNDPGPGNPNVSDPLEDGSGDHPFDTVQEAIDAAVDGDEIIVETGTYPEQLMMYEKGITIRSSNPADPDVVAATIIQADSEPYGSGNVVQASDGTLDGLTLRNGSTGVNYAVSGEGAFSPTVQRCVIEGCYYGIKGYVHYHPEDIYPVIRNNIIYGRLSGVWLDHQAISGGVHATIQNNVIIGSEATYGRGIVYRMHKSLPIVTGNIIARWNEGLELVYTSLEEQRRPLITNNCMWDNNYDFYHGGYIPYEIFLPVMQGNIHADPLWVDPDNGGFHLQEESPCIDAGNLDFGASPGETDIDGEPRIQNCRVDIGPDETSWFIDCNDNDLPDACEVLQAGDFNGDGIVDLDDYAGFTECLGGPEGTPTHEVPACITLCLAAFDFDEDQDIDLGDFAEFSFLITD